jgi:hypothetical protein
MKSLLVQLDEPTFRALNRVAPARLGKRAEFVRVPIRHAEEERTRNAYLAHPYSAADADDWANAEKWKA